MSSPVNKKNSETENKSPVSSQENENKEQSQNQVEEQFVHPDEDCITQESPREQTQEEQTDDKYVALMETSGQECESWYYFIKYEPNKENLEYLQKQLESVNWYILDDLSTFDLDLEHFVSEKTAKEMTKLELNHYSFHRKFDGLLEKIELGLRKKDRNEKKMVKVFDILGYGQIEDFIDKEDIDEEDLTSSNETSSESESEEETESDTVSESESEDEEKTKKNKRKKGIPPALLKSNLPRFAKAKRRQRKGKH